jgi:hypothetical protein
MSGRDFINVRANTISLVSETGNEVTVELEYWRKALQLSGNDERSRRSALFKAATEPETVEIRRSHEQVERKEIPGANPAQTREESSLVLLPKSVGAIAPEDWETGLDIYGSAPRLIKSFRDPERSARKPSRGRGEHRLLRLMARVQGRTGRQN